MTFTYWYDQDYSYHYTGTLGNGHLLFDADSLEEGFHTLYLSIGDDSTVRLENIMFYLPPVSMVDDSVSLSYSYWYDQDYSHHNDGILGNGHLLLEVDSLHEGFHTLYMTLGSGTTMRLESFMFYLPPNHLQSDSNTTEYSYWFDQDYSHHYSGTLGDGHLLFNTGSLHEGFHTMYLTIGEGTTVRLESIMLYVPFEQASTAYTDLAYWFDGETTVHRVTPMEGHHTITPPTMNCGEWGTIHFMGTGNQSNTTTFVTRQFIMMDSTCCLPPLFVTVDSVSDTGAYMHWDYNRPMSYTLAYDTVPFDNPDSCDNIVTLTDTTFHFAGMHAGITCHYAIKANCDSSADAWVRGEWSTVCRTLTPVYVEACDSYDWRGNTYHESGT